MNNDKFDFTIIAILSVIFCIGIIVFLPVWQITELSNFKNLPISDRQLLINDNRTVIINALTGIVVVFALILTFRRLKVSEEQIKISQDQLKSINTGQFNDRYIRSIELLKIENPSELKIAGLISIKNLALEKPIIIEEIIELLTSFISTRASIFDPLIESSEFDLREIKKAYSIILQLLEKVENNIYVRFESVYLPSFFVTDRTKTEKIKFIFKNCRIDTVMYLFKDHQKKIDIEFSDCFISLFNDGLEKSKGKTTFNRSIIRNLSKPSLNPKIILNDSIIKQFLNFFDNQNLIDYPFIESKNSSIILTSKKYGDLNSMISEYQKNQLDIISKSIQHESTSFYYSDFSLIPSSELSNDFFEDNLRTFKKEDSNLIYSYKHNFKY